MSLDYNCIDLCNNTPYLASKVDFNKMKNAGVKYVIFRAIRRRLITDESFEIYYKGAKEAGLKIGVYLYSYAGCDQSTGARADVMKNWSTKNCVSYAKLEASALVNLLNNRKLDLPVFYDLEERAQAKILKKEYITKISEAFKEIVEKAGYTFGLYCDQDYYNAYIDKKKWKNTPTWIAKYSEGKPTCCEDNLIGWQYKGTVSGEGLPSGLKCDRTHWYGIKSTNTTKEESTKEVITETKKEPLVTTKAINYYGRISNCTSLNIRKGPGSSYKSIGIYKSNEIVHITEEAYEDGKSTGWGKTNKGWISYKKYTTKAIGKITITCNSLNLRSSMNAFLSNNIKKVAKKNDTYVVMDIKKASNGTTWYWLSNGYYCSSNNKYSKYTSL